MVAAVSNTIAMPIDSPIHKNSILDEPNPEIAEINAFLPVRTLPRSPAVQNGPSMKNATRSNPNYQFFSTPQDEIKARRNWEKTKSLYQILREGWKKATSRNGTASNSLEISGKSENIALFTKDSEGEKSQIRTSPNGKQIETHSTATSINYQISATGYSGENTETDRQQESGGHSVPIDSTTNEAIRTDKQPFADRDTVAATNQGIKSTVNNNSRPNYTTGKLDFSANTCYGANDHRDAEGNEENCESQGLESFSVNEPPSKPTTGNVAKLEGSHLSNGTVPKPSAPDIENIRGNWPVVRKKDDTRSSIDNCSKKHNDGNRPNDDSKQNLTGNFTFDHSGNENRREKNYQLHGKGNPSEGDTEIENSANEALQLKNIRRKDAPNQTTFNYLLRKENYRKPDERENKSNSYNFRIKMDDHKPSDIDSSLMEFHRNQRALTMLSQVPVFSGGPTHRFDRWIKQFEAVVNLSNWSDEEKVHMLSIKMTDKAHDIVQNILECETYTFQELKGILNIRFHGNETIDYYQKKFDDAIRKPGETILDFAFRLKTLFQRGYPGETEEKPLRNKILRQKFIEGLEIELKSKIRHRKIDQFEDLVAEANKYSIRLEVDKEERSKNEFVRAITETTIGDAKIDSILDLMNKQNESINAIQEKIQNSRDKFSTLQWDSTASSTTTLPPDGTTILPNAKSHSSF